MSRRDKLLKKLNKKPPPTDFRWDDLVTLLEGHGFRGVSHGSSHYTFQHKSGFTFGLSKTHPSGILKLYQVEKAKEALNNVRVNKNGCEKDNDS